MPAKLYCDHAEGFESGLRDCELDVREWERASGTALADAVKYTVMMNMAPIFLGTVCSLVHMPTVPLFRNFVANPTESAGNGTSADDDRMQVDSLKKDKEKSK